MDTRRGMVEFNTQRFSRWAKKNVASGADVRDELVRDEYVKTGEVRRGSRPQVLLWADSFSEYLSDAGARATVEVLEAAGFEVLLPESQACCGLTLISTGQLDAARGRLTNTMEVLAPYAQKGIPIVGIEPELHRRAAQRPGGSVPGGRAREGDRCSHPDRRRGPGRDRDRGAGSDGQDRSWCSRTAISTR